MIVIVEGTDSSGRKELSHFFQANGFMRVKFDVLDVTDRGIDRFSYSLGTFMGMIGVADGSSQLGQRNDWDIDFVFDSFRITEWGMGFGGYSLRDFKLIDDRLWEAKAKLIYADNDHNLGDGEEFQRSLMRFLFDQSRLDKCRYDLEDMDSNKLLQWVRFG